MKSREEELAGRLRAYLDQAVADLRPGLAYRLQQARAQALARLAENAQEAESGRLVGAPALVGAGAGGGNLRHAPHRPVLVQGRLWLAVGVVALAILGWQQWTAWQALDELEEIDAQILTSDLPVDALADRGFQVFLEIAPPPMPMPVEVEEAPADAAPAAPTGEGGDAGPAPAGMPPVRSGTPSAEPRFA